MATTGRFVISVLTAGLFLVLADTAAAHIDFFAKDQFAGLLAGVAWSALYDYIMKGR